MEDDEIDLLNHKIELIRARTKHGFNRRRFKGDNFLNGVDTFLKKHKFLTDKQITAIDNILKQFNIDV